MDKEGIREHQSLGVEPRLIKYHSRVGEPTRMEKGFSFEIPKKKQEKLKTIFLNGRRVIRNVE